jgi:hypothetical protein
MKLRMLRIRRYWPVHICAVLLLVGSVTHTALGYTHSDLAGHGWGTDDAYISYRYAQNMYEGHGLVFNPGERVEGYSNFLYVLLLTSAFLVGAGDQIYLFSVAINMVLIVAALYVFARYISRSLGNTNGVLASLLFALAPPIWIWVASGMETSLVVLITLLMLVTIERLVKDPQQNVVPACILMMLAILARADGFITVVVAVVCLAVRGRYKATIWTSAVLAGTLTVYSAWRLSYYGDLLPNTYYAKVSGPLFDRIAFAIRQLWGIAMNEGLFVYLLAFLFAAAPLVVGHLRRSKMATRELWGFDTIFIPVWLLYWLYIGADHFQERFLVVLYPLGLVTFFRHIVPALRRTGRAFLVVLVIVLQLRMIVLDNRFQYTFDKHDRYIQLGQFLGEHYSGKLLAADAVGKIPYFSGLQTIDMLGLNDRYIAHTEATFFDVGHNKYDADYVISRCPDLIVAWVHDEDMNLARGLTREKYEGKYRLTYLVNASAQSAQDNIVEVSAFSSSAIVDLYDEGYIFAVLEKVRCPTTVHGNTNLLESTLIL